MKTDKILHLIQQKNVMRSGGALPLPKAQTGIPDVQSLLSEYKNVQEKVNQGYQDDYVTKLRKVADKAVKEGFVLENTDIVPKNILNSPGSNYCIGTSCYLANQAGDPFSFYSNALAQDYARDNPKSTRYLEQDEKYIEPGDIIQYKSPDEKGPPYHAYTVLDIGNSNQQGYKPIRVAGSTGTGPVIYANYYLGPDNKIYKNENAEPLPTQLLKRRQSGRSGFNEIVKRRNELKSQLDAINPEILNPKPTVRSNNVLPTEFMFNRSGWYGGDPTTVNYEGGDNVYALEPTATNRFADQIFTKESKLPEILQNISDINFKENFMKRYNIRSDEYDAIAKTMLGIYGAESKFGTDYWGSGKLPEPQGLSKLLGIGSVGPFQINRKNLSKDLREKYTNKDLHDPQKAAQATMEFLAEGMTGKGMNLRARAKKTKDSPMYMRNVNPDNYLEYLPYLHNQPGWLTGDKATMESKGDIVAGEHPYKQLVDYYSGLFDVLPSSISTPVEITGERISKKSGGLAKAQRGRQSGFITYSDNPDYFNSRAVLSDDPTWNDKVKQLIYQGKAAYDPSTGAIQFIDSSGAPADVQQMATRGYTEGVRRDPTDPRYAGAEDRTRQLIEQSTQEAYQNPLMYAPGSIGMAMLPATWGTAYGLTQAGTQALQGNYGNAALTAGLSMLPIAGTATRDYLIPKALQSSLARRVLPEETLTNLVAKNISLNNYNRYFPKHLGSGAFGEAVTLKNFPNLVIKAGSSNMSSASMGDVQTPGAFESIPFRPGQIYPRYYKSQTNIPHPEFINTPPFDFQVMSYVPGKPLNRLTGNQMAAIPKESWKQLMDEIEYLRTKNVGIDFAGDNISYDPVTKRFGLYDLTPNASAANPDWRDWVLKNISVDDLPTEARDKIKEAVLAKVDNFYSNKSGELGWRFARNTSPSLLQAIKKHQQIVNSDPNMLLNNQGVSADFNRFMNWRDQLNDKRSSVLQTIQGLKKGGLTSAKAKEILHDKSVHGHPLTDKQRKFFGAIASGNKIRIRKNR